MASLNFTYDIYTSNALVEIAGESNGGESTLTIDWGDGTPIQTDYQYNHIIQHTYAIIGTYNVTLTVTLTTLTWLTIGGLYLTHVTQFPTKVKNLQFYAADKLISVPSTFNPVDYPELTNFSEMFNNCSSFNQDIGSWITSSVTNMSGMFSIASSFNKNINSWNTSSVTDMSNMFYGASSFDSPLGSWNTGNVEYMQGMFVDASNFGSVNRGLGSWNTIKVKNMDQMFYGATKFNDPIGSWNTGNVESMNTMFRDCPTFNTPLNWNTSKVKNMSQMFNRATSFNQNINTNTGAGTWVTSAVTDMYAMFNQATSFNQNISDWDIRSVTNMQDMFRDAHIIQRPYYDAMLTKWAALPVQSNVPFNAGVTTKYSCNSPASTARDTVLIGSKLWTITDGGCDLLGLKLVLDLTLSNQPSVRPFDITVVNATANLTFDWGDGSTPTVKTPGSYNVSHSYGASPTINIVTVSITGTTNSCDSITLKTPYSYGCEMVTSCIDFGDITKNLSFYLASNLTSVPTTLPSNMTNLESMFHACISFNSSNVYGWNTTNVTNMKDMFGGARIFDQDLSGWNTSNVANMESMFIDAQKFNGSVGSWGTGNVTNMKNMFAYAYKFNQNISSWNTSNVENMEGMFNSASIFDQNINTNTGSGTWVTTKVTNMKEMFRNAPKFNQSLNNWDTGAVTTMYNMFSEATLFNGNISAWNVGNVLTMFGMFSDTPFNQNISGWKPNKLEDAGAMFWRDSAFNQNINTNTGAGTWVTTSVKSMYGMFYEATSFNQDIGDWDTINVENMGSMFQGATIFNQDISGWNTGKVNNMRTMFADAIAFNQDIGGWNTAEVTEMTYMFTGATAFDQDISDWNVSKVTTMEDMFLDAHIIQRPYYDAMLTKWGQLPVQNSVRFHAGTSTQYTCSTAVGSPGYYRNTILSGDNGWIITDGECFQPIVDYYVDINPSYTTTGTGTTTDPYNRSQFLSIMNSGSIDDGMTYHIRGKLELAPGEPQTFVPYLMQTPSPISITLRGWDIATNGCPIISWNDPSGISYGNAGNRWWSAAPNATYANVSVTIQDFIVKCSYGFYDYYTVGDTCTLTYKDVHFVTYSYNDTFLSQDQYEKRNYYGCTFDIENAYFGGVGLLTFSDCVFNNYIISIHDFGKLTTFNNVTNKTQVEFTDSIQGGDLSTYVVPYSNPSIISTPVLQNFDEFCTYYTNANAMYYKLFNIGTSNNATLTAYRTANGYNNGLFNEPRLSYGAYSFLGNIPIVPQVFPTSGSIGSFYFGGKFDNVVTANNTLSVTIIPNDVNKIEVDTYITVKGQPYFTMLPVGDKKYVETQKSLSVDFVAKRRGNSTFPKFCECGNYNCDTAENAGDRDYYEKPITGGDPLIVDFIACSYAEGGEYVGYTPTHYYWYFDAGNDLSISATTTEPTVTHTYCGGYLESFDVKLCVDFSKS